MIWKEQHKELGEVKTGTTLNIEFEGDYSDGIGIKEIKSSCGCTKAHFIKDRNVVSIRYKTKSIPYHLAKQGWYETKKSIIVVDTNNKKTVLSFKVKIIK